MIDREGQQDRDKEKSIMRGMHACMGIGLACTKADGGRQAEKERERCSGVESVTYCRRKATIVSLGEIIAYLVVMESCGGRATANYEAPLYKAIRYPLTSHGPPPSDTGYDYVRGAGTRVYTSALPPSLHRRPFPICTNTQSSGP